MDSLSQIALGGAVGEAILGKKVGNKAILWGAIGGTIPDLDTIPGQFMDTVSRLEIHRGFSHSIVFAILLAPLLTLLVRKIYSNDKGGFWGWTQLFFWSLFTHPLLDIFTTWGTQLFWPFEWRIALHSIFVIDPMYTLPLLICLIVVLFLKRGSFWRKRFNRAGLIVSCLYLGWTLIAKLYANNQFEKAFAKENIEPKSYQSRPTFFNTILWTANIEMEDRFLVSYYSILDKNLDLNYRTFRKNHELLNPYRNHPKIEKLIFLTKGYFIMEEDDSGIIMHDLRFGLKDGFDSEHQDFVFSYLIRNDQNGKLEISQIERSFRGAEKVLEKSWQRLKGIKSV